MNFKKPTIQTPLEEAKISRRDFLKKGLSAGMAIGGALVTDAFNPERLYAGTKELNRYLSKRNIEKEDIASLDQIRNELYLQSLSEDNEQIAVLIKEKEEYKRIPSEKISEATPKRITLDVEFVHAIWGKNIDTFKEVHFIHTHNEKARLAYYKSDGDKFPGIKNVMPPSGTDFMNWVRHVFFATGMNVKKNGDYPKIPIHFGVEEPKASWRIHLSLNQKDNPGIISILTELNKSYSRISGYSDKLIQIYIDRLDDSLIPELTGEKITKEELKTKNRDYQNLIIWACQQIDPETSFMRMLANLVDKRKKIMENTDSSKEDILIKEYQAEATLWGFDVECVKR